MCASALHAQTAKPLQNPYNSELAALVAELQSASAPQAAVLLERIYDLRDYVDDPSDVTRAMTAVANDSRRHPLVRAEGQHFLALIDVHENRPEAARVRMAQLGFVRAWAIVGPFATSKGLDAQLGPEQGFNASREYADSAHKRRWRVVPDYGPHAWMDVSDFYPQATGLVFAGTSLLSGSRHKVALRFSADSALAAFVNGRQVFRDDTESGIGFDQHAVAVELQAGWNSVVLKLYRAESGPWRVGLRVTELDGKPLVLTVAARESHVFGSSVAEPAQPDDLVAMAQKYADTDPSAANLETLGRLERAHARGSWLEHFEAAARRGPTATRWLLVARSCAEPACRFAALNAAANAEPGNVTAALALADYYSARRQLEKARDLLRAAAERDPANFVVRKRLTDLYVSAGLNSLALQQCRRLQAEFHRPLWLRRELAGRYEDFGLLNDAEVLLSSSLPQNWDDKDARALLVHIYARRRDTDRLRAAYKDAIRLNPTDTQLRARVAELTAGDGNVAAAERELRAALDVAPESDELHQQFAEVLASAGKTKEAQGQLACALELNPQLADVRRRLQILGAEHDSDPDHQFLADASQFADQAHQLARSTDSNAVLLADTRVERVYDNGLSSVRSQQIFYIVNDQGARELSTRSVQYTPGSQQLEVLAARIYKPDGRMLEAEDGGEGAVAEDNAAMYYDVRAHRTRFPALEAGDVLEFDYRVSPTIRTNAYGDYFGDLVVFGAPQPEKLKRFVLITPDQRRFNVFEARMPTAAKISQQNGQRTYVWEVHDLPPFPNEPRAPAITEIAPYVNVSTFASWQDLGRWYAQLVRPQFALDSALRDTLQQIVAGEQTELDKVRAIHEFVLRNTHYVALEFGIYSYKPYPVTQTFARRFGDCKDKASLMIALLRAAGIEADIALVRTRRLGDVDPRAASISVFNHAVAYLPRYDMWLDGTAEYASARELPLEDQGAMALTVSADGQAQLRRIPVTTADANYTRRTVQARIQANGAIRFSGTAYSRGEDAPGLRREYGAIERQREAFRDHLAEVFPSVHLDEVQVEGANDLDRDITVNFRGTLDSFAGRRSLSLAASWMTRSYVQTLAPLISRTQPLVLPAPWTTEEEIHFLLPAGAVVESMPANTVLETPFGSANILFERQGGEIVVHTSVQFRKLRIAPAEYAAFRDFCDQLERAFRGEVKVAL